MYRKRYSAIGWRLRKLWLFLGIVWRYDQTETRMSRGLAWEVAGIIWNKDDER